MAQQQQCHGNTGVRIKHLTVLPQDCPHFPSSSMEPGLKCAMLTCEQDATIKCHVIMANQNAKGGKRNLISICQACNEAKKGGGVRNIRQEATMIELPHCKCGELA